MMYVARGSAHETLDRPQMKETLFAALDALGPRERVLVLPPDFTVFIHRPAS